MKLCPHIGCLYSQNSDTARFCNKCSGQLLLQDRYHLLRFIGCGGFSRTFLAVDEHKNRCVIKQLCFPKENGESFQKAVKLFRQEAILLHELQHLQIPQLLGYFEQSEYHHLRDLLAIRITN